MSTDQTNHEAPASSTLVDKVVSFLNRDVASFFGGARPGNHAAKREDREDTPQLAAPAEPAIASLVDPGHLSFLAFQRQVLDWRDNAHAEITSTMADLCRTFADHIDRKLEGLGLLGQFFPDPADEVLQHELILRIQEPINACLYRQEAALASITEKEAHTPKGSLSFRRERLITEDTYLSGLKFNSSDRAKIVQKLQAWILGPHGLADEFRDQTTRMADRLIQERHAC